MHQLTAGFTDLLAVWTRIKGVCAHIRPVPDDGFGSRIGFGQLVLSEDGHERHCTSLADAMQHVLAVPNGLIAVRGGNGSGKSTLLAALKARLQGGAYYWPTHDRLAFAFNSVGTSSADEEVADDPEEIRVREEALQKRGYSSGERQLQVLREIVANTAYPVYLLDEWDANLDAANRSSAVALVEQLARRARVIEVSHRDGR